MAVVDILKGKEACKSCLLNGVIGSACGVHGQGSNMQTPPPAPTHKYSWTQFSTPRAANIGTDALIKKSYMRRYSHEHQGPHMPRVYTYEVASPPHPCPALRPVPTEKVAAG